LSASDGTTLNANAVMKSIARRDDGRGYEAFFTDRAKTSDIEAPTRADLARRHRKREKQRANADWHNPFGAEAKISTIKDGSTRSLVCSKTKVTRTSDGCTLNHSGSTGGAHRWALLAPGSAGDSSGTRPRSFYATKG
jgi:hypothetical protein